MTIGRFAQRWTIGLVLTSALGFGCTNEAAPDEDPVANETTVKLQNELAAEAALNPATAATVRPVKPTLKCVERLTSSSYRAHFGYVNTSSSSIPIPVGFYNRFFPSPQGRGQPTAFAHGTSPDVVQVAFSGSSLIAWILGSGVVTATRNSTGRAAPVSAPRPVTITTRVRRTCATRRPTFSARTSPPGMEPLATTETRARPSILASPGCARRGRPRFASRSTSATWPAPAIPPPGPARTRSRPTASPATTGTDARSAMPVRRASAPAALPKLARRSTSVTSLARARRRPACAATHRSPTARCATTAAFAPRSTSVRPASA